MTISNTLEQASQCTSINTPALTSQEDYPYQYSRDAQFKRHAWCPELDCIVTTADVWQRMYNSNHIEKRLTFYCIDPCCRVPMLIKNCYPYAADTEASFRLQNRRRHHHDCSYDAEQLRLQRHHMSKEYRQRFLKRYRIDGND